jgi:RecJ-like exonuclease
MRHEHKRPLIIVVDNGSSSEDLMSLRKLKIYGAQLMVIDHHPPYPDNDRYIDVHINPHFITSSYALSAGMICAEIAHQLIPDLEDLDLLAALSGVADRCEGMEIDQYLKLAEAKGYDRQRIRETAECIDFETYYLGFLESRYMVDDLFFGDLEKHKELISMISEKVSALKARHQVAVREYTAVADMGTFALASLDVESISFEGEYPRRGKLVGMALDYARESMKKPAVAYGYGSDFITLRCDKSLDVDLGRIIAMLKESLPHALVQGGGHAKAGSINFIRASSDEVRTSVHESLAKAKYINP